MAHHLIAPIVDHRPATQQLRWLTLQAADLARAAAPGQYLLVRCAVAGVYDPLLRRPLFVAAAEEALGQIGLLYEPDDPGLVWLARSPTGEVLDLIGLLGHSFALDRRTRTLLLVGQGPGLAALLLLARQAVARGCSVTLLAGATEPGALPPAFLLPGEVEYEATVGAATDLLNRPSTGTSLDLITWADQICAALPVELLAPLANAVRTVKYRWERGFATVLPQAPLLCGTGACGACPIDTRRGRRLACSDGPVFDLRDLDMLW